MPSHAVRHLTHAALWAALAGCFPAGAQAAVFVCRDAHGDTVTTDHASADCLQYGGKELNADGSVRRLILTPRQQQQQEQAEQRSRAASEQALQDQRQQRALLARYPDESVLQDSEQSDLASVQALIDAARARLKVLHRERVHLDEDAQFYPSGNYPNDLRSRMEMNQQERRQEQQLIASQQREVARIHARYDRLRASLRVLWARQRAAERIESSGH